MPNKILDDLIAAGVPSDTILAVAEMIAQVKVTTDTVDRDANRRSMDAARQQRYRQRITMSRNGNVTSRDRNVTPPPDGFPHTPFLNPPESSKPKRVSRSLAQLPADWKLGEEGKTYARNRGWAESKVESEEERFRDHALATGRKARDWLAAWRNWVTSPYQKQPNGQGNGHGNPAMAAIDKLIARAEENESAGGFGEFDLGGPIIEGR